MSAFLFYFMNSTILISVYDFVDCLKGLAMIFAGQENPFIIFRSKEIYIYFKPNNKIPIKFAEVMKKSRE